MRQANFFSTRYQLSTRKISKTGKKPWRSHDTLEVCEVYNRTRIIPFAFIRQASISTADSHYH